MGLTLIHSKNKMRIVHNAYGLQTKQALSVVYRKVEKPVIRLIHC